MSNQVTFPYASFEQGHADGWKKLGGTAEAYRFIVNGYKGTIWRKQSNSKRQDMTKEAIRLYKAHLAKSGGDRADRQIATPKPQGK